MVLRRVLVKFTKMLNWERAANKLFELNSDEGGYYVLFVSIYESASKWNKVAEVKKAI
uniref:Uncharacterized protein n=1 Tax=Cucumis melo TaxID=3656 RepID=A0A9I9DUN1_CUCME